MTVTEKEGGKESNQTHAEAATTTLNIVFNGTMVMGFHEDRVEVIAPLIPDNRHLYLMNQVNFQGAEVPISINGKRPAPASWSQLFEDDRVVMRFDRSQTGSMPAPKPKQDALIVLPYPDKIYPLRLLDMTFDNKAGNGRWAGALVFAYSGVVASSVVVGKLQCQPRNAVSGYSELYVLASIPPHEDDPDEHHSRMSWVCAAKLLNKNWEWGSATEVDLRAPGMDRDVDKPDLSPKNLSGPLKTLGGGNCKVPLAVVTFKP